MTERNTFTKEQEAWLKALESGEYKQVTQNLCTGGAYCCLGVATHVVNPKHHALESNGWDWDDFYDDFESDDRLTLGPDEMTAPADVATTLRLDSTEGRFRFGFNFSGGIRSLIGLNDGGGWTFPEIAEFIRAKPWLVFTNFDQPEEASK